MATKPTDLPNASDAVAAACAAWATAPLHIKAMAGAYVRPIIIALEALKNDIQVLKKSE